MLASRGIYEGFVLKLDAGGKFQKVWRMVGTGLDTARVDAVLHTEAGPQLRVAGPPVSPSADYPTGGQFQNPDGKRDAFLMAFDGGVLPTTSPVAYVVGGSAVEGGTGQPAVIRRGPTGWSL